MTDRLDRIETDLEKIKEILFTTARRAEFTDNRIEEQNRIADERGRKIDERLDRLSENLNQLREDVDIAFKTISLLSENTDRSMTEFRAEMRDSRAETRAIWEYLMRKSQNGDGNV